MPAEGWLYENLNLILSQNVNITIHMNYWWLSIINNWPDNARARGPPSCSDANDYTFLYTYILYNHCNET